MQYTVDTREFRAALEKIRCINPEAVQVLGKNNQVHLCAMTHSYTMHGYRLFLDISMPSVGVSSEDGESCIIGFKSFLKPGDIEKRATGNVEINSRPGSPLNICRMDGPTAGQTWSLQGSDKLNDVYGNEVRPGATGEPSIFTELAPSDCRMFGFINRALSKNKTRPAFTGAQVTQEAVTSTDGFRLATAPFTAKPEGEGEGIMPPELVAFIAAGNTGFLELYGDMFVLTGENFVFYARCVEGKFPDFDMLMSRPPATTAVLDTNDTIKTLKMLSKGMRSPILVLQGHNATCRVRGSEAPVEQRTARIAVLSGEIKDLAVNPMYLLDALSNYDGDSFTLDTVDGDSPILLTRKDNARAAIMPIEA